HLSLARCAGNDLERVVRLTSVGGAVLPRSGVGDDGVHRGSGAQCEGAQLALPSWTKRIDDLAPLQTVRSKHLFDDALLSVAHPGAVPRAVAEGCEERLRLCRELLRLRRAETTRRIRCVR